MSLASPSPGWAVAIGGEAHDLQSLQLQLAPPGEPWVEADSQNPNSLLLRSTHWTKIVDAADIHANAQRMMKWLNGAFPLTTMGAQPFELGAVYKFNEQGGRSVNVFLQATMLAIGTARVLVTTNGQMVPRFAGDLRKWLSMAPTDPLRAQILESLNRMDDWGDIYKAAEAVRLLAGGQGPLKAALIASGHWLEWDRCWQTANYYRHAVGGHSKLPAVPASQSNARDIVRAAAFLYL